MKLKKGCRCQHTTQSVPLYFYCQTHTSFAEQAQLCSSWQSDSNCTIFLLLLGPDTSNITYPERSSGWIQSTSRKPHSKDVFILPNVTGPNSFLPVILRFLQVRLQLCWLYLHTSPHGCWLNFLFCSTNSIKLEFQMEAFQIRSRSAYHMKACDVTWWGDWPWEYCRAPSALSKTSTITHHSQKLPVFCTATIEKPNNLLGVTRKSTIKNQKVGLFQERVV